MHKKINPGDGTGAQPRAIVGNGNGPIVPQLNGRSNGFAEIDQILSRLEKVRQNGRDAWMACCPAHEDRTPSLSVKLGDNGRVLLYCHAGCTYEAIMGALGMGNGHAPLSPARPVKRERTTRPVKQKEWGNVVATYDYVDAAGVLLFQKLRYESKDFSIRRPIGNGRFVKGMGDAARVLYRLPELLDPDRLTESVFVTEGEKDADRLASLGLLATTNYDGAGKWRSEYNEWLTGRVVYLLEDNDDQGRKHVQRVASELSPVAVTVTVVALPGLPEKGDVSDWLDMGGTVEQFLAICATAPVWTAGSGEPTGPAVPAVSLEERLPLADLRFIQQCLVDEEMGDGALLAHVYDGRLVYDHTVKKAGDGWYMWAGHSWKPDNRGLIKLLYSAQVADQYLRAAGEWGKQAAALRANGSQAGIEQLEQLREKALTRTRQLRKVARTRNALDYAASYPEVAVTSEVWDTNPYLLGVANGVIDLRTGEFTAGRPGDYIRMVAPTEWAGPDAPCPRFERFISEIVGHDLEMVGFMQRLLGYGISGLATEHVFPIFWGADGRNGKDTLLETLGHVLGDTAGAVSKDVVLSLKSGAAGAATPHLAALRGRRLVWASEPNQGARLDAGQVKMITGGGRIRARALNENEIEFTPTHLLILVTNPRPHMPADDNALWERVLLIPFEQRFVSNPNPAKTNEHQADKKLGETLLQESSGILAWLVRGFAAWQTAGALRPPERVVAATGEYRNDEDTIGQFINECCVVKSGCQVKAGEFYTAYCKWCADNNLLVMTGTAFGERMRKRFERLETTAGRVYVGVGLLAHPPV